MLQEKYQSVLDLGQELNIQDGDVREEDGKLLISGTTQTPYEKDVLWNEIKRVGGDEADDIQADIKVADDSRYHVHTVEKGDTLGAIAKHYYGKANKYPEIFEANRDILDDASKIRRGQELVIPNLEVEEEVEVQEEAEQTLQEKYQSVLDLGQELNIQDGDVREEDGKLLISGTTQTPYEKDVLWNEIKRVGGDEPTDIQADIKVADDSRYHVHTVEKGDTLGAIAKHYYSKANKYPEIFEANRDVLDDPSKIRRGQELVIPIIEL